MRARLLIAVATLMMSTLVIYAQGIHVPDPSLRAAITEALSIPYGAPITEADMNLLTQLDANGKGIMELSGLDTATQLVSLSLGQNAIADLSPLTHLTNMRSLDLRFNQINDISPLSRLIKLEILIVPDNRINDLGPLAHLPRLVELNARVNPISDVAPLFHLTTLKYLDLGGCRIVNIFPLSNLTNLQVLQLNNNQIVDVSPLSNLTSLYKLEIQYNHIVDHSPLDSLSLDIFYYDQTCDMPSLPLEPRLENRNYPSIFSRWTGFGAYPVSNRPDLSEAENLALHDLWFGGDVFGLFLFETGNTFAIRGNIEHATRQRDELLANNPNIIQLRTLSARAASLDSFPKDWPHWLRDEQGNIFLGRDSDGTIWTNGIMDITQPEVQNRIVEQAIAVDKCGLYDGIIFDYWSDSWRVLGSWDGTRDYFPYSLEEERRARLNIVRRIQAATRPNFLIMGNTNRAILPITGPYVNGGFMETVFPAFHAEDALHHSLTEIEDSLYWLDTNLRQPRINGLEGWSIPTEPPDSPMNLRWMRAITTLSLTHSNGYVVFTEPVKWTHYWYDFWDVDLGRPMGEKAQLYQDIDGLYIREFTNGWALYNHSGSPQVIRLPEEVQGVASGLVNTEHALPNLDGEMYLRVKAVNPADVNGDGIVNILDLILVAQGFGTDSLEGDVNGDGVVNVFDLVQVAGALGGGGAAPSAYSLDPSIISAADVARWLALAQGSGVGDATFQQGIRFLEGLLAALTPKKTTLLPNYPNPFNPETWIPYHLVQEAEVAITIYDTKGTPVRRLTFGNQAAGYYAERGKAAYWDGRNEDGEAVASGIYIYQFRAGNYAESRRMVIVK